MMRKPTSITIAVGLTTLAAMTTVPPASAADLSVEVSKPVAYRKVVRLRPVARDYDGTPVFFRPYRTVSVAGPDGRVVARVEYEAVSVAAAPSRYTNGEPVLPPYPRGWPRQATERYRSMAGLR